MENVTGVAPEVVKHKRGRPRKDAIQAAKKPNNGKVGRPAGDNARMAEFKARLMSTTGTRVIDKVLEVALTDGHPAQSACLKMCMDRLLPVAMFDDKGNGNSKPTIQINIQGLNDTSMSVIQSNDDNEEIEDGEYEEV
jgi:hypothetical protein